MNRIIQRCPFAGPAHGRHDWKVIGEYTTVCPGDSFGARLLAWAGRGFRRWA